MINLRVLPQPTTEITSGKITKQSVSRTAMFQTGGVGEF